MKKLLTLLTFGIFLCSTCSFAVTLLDDAVTWAYTKKLTIYLNTDDFKPNNNIRRDEAAKFFVNFAKLVGKTSYTVNANQCNFSDLNQAWSDLKDIIVESCRLGIFKGSGGKFNPAGNLSNAEAIAVLVRIVDGYQSESGTHWSDNYYKRANELKLLANVGMSTKDGSASRGNMVTLLYGARQMKGVVEASQQVKIIQDQSYLVDHVFANEEGGSCANGGEYYRVQRKQLSEKYKNYTIVKKDCNWNLDRGTLWTVSPFWYPTDRAACFELRVYDTKKDTSLCEGVSSLYQTILKKNYADFSAPTYGYSNDGGGYKRNQIQSLRFDKYFPSCEMILREVVNIDTDCGEHQYPTMNYQDFIQPITYLLYEDWKKERGKIPYRNGYITIEIEKNLFDYDQTINVDFLYHTMDRN